MSNLPIEHNGFKFGLHRDRPDPRDYPMFRTPVNLAKQPKSKNLEKYLPDATMMDQGPTGSCVGYSGVQTVYAAMIKNGHFAPFVGSPVFMYREARALGGYVHEDSGTELRLFWKAMAENGMPRFEELPPDFNRTQIADINGIFPENSIWRRQPPQSVYDSAAKTQAIQYYRLNNAAEIIASIAAGWPVQFGYAVFDSTFDHNGKPKYTIDLPEKGDYIVGYHAVCGYGYNLNLKVPRIYFRNNWGKYAHEGRPNFSLPIKYVDDYKLDVWTIRIVEGGKAVN